MADIKLKQLEDQLKRIGCNYRFWSRPELRELAQVLLPGEQVEHCVIGSYEGGFALLVATNQRTLLIDKKPFYLTLEDIRFDMISEIDYNHRLLNASVYICTPNKSLRFIGYNRDRLRKLFHYVQTQVMEIRQHYQHQGQLWKEYANSLQEEEQQAPAPPAAAYVPDTTQQLGGPQQPQQLFQQQLPAAGPTTEQLVAASQPLPQPHQPQHPRMPLHPMAYHTVAPGVSAYTRLPMMSRQRRFLGSRAVRAPQLT